MAFTIRTVCREYSRLIKESAKSNTMIELNLAICKDGKTVFKSYKIKGKLELKHWNNSSGKVKNGCIFADELNLLIRDTETEYNQVGLFWEIDKKNFTANDLVNYKKKIESNDCLLVYLHVLMDRYRENGTGNFSVYRMLYSEFKNFTKNKGISILNIDDDYLMEYIKWCIKKHNHTRTIKEKFNRIISVLKKARKDGFRVQNITITYTPAPEIKVKRGLSENDVINILSYTPRTKKRQFVWDMFLFMYYAAGISFSDLAYLSIENLNDNRLTYIRRKTHRPINVVLPDQALEIIRKYENRGGKYLFPIIPIEKQKQSYVDLYDFVRSRIICFNSALKSIGRELQISVSLTTYVARHTYATQLLRSGIPLPMISKALGHSTIQMTQNYLNLNDFDLTQTFDCLTPKSKIESTLTKMDDRNEQPMKGIEVECELNTDNSVQSTGYSFI